MEGIVTHIWVTTHYLQTLVSCIERWATTIVRRQAVTVLNAKLHVGVPLTAGALRPVPHRPHS